MVDWRFYKGCSTCGAKPAQPCISQGKNSRGKEMARPHSWRDKARTDQTPKPVVRTPCPSYHPHYTRYQCQLVLEEHGDTPDTHIYHDGRVGLLIWHTGG